MKKMIYFIFSVFLLSCTQVEPEEVSEELVIENYNSYSSKNKTLFWVDRIEKVSSLKDLDDKQISLINEFKLNLEETGIDKLASSDESMQLIEQLFKTIKANDLIEIFSINASIPDHSLKGGEYFTFDKNSFSNKSEFIGGNELTARRTTCNCRWTCWLLGETNRNCTPTSHGCGFLWIQGCNQVL